MNRELDSVCPIFVRYENDIVEQIGSGVLLRIKDKMFLLTAAHVSDWSEKGDLCIPTKNGIQAIAGYFASILSPMGLRRSKDKIDMFYFQLDNSLVKNMHEDFKPLHRNECWLTDNTLPDDLYTFSGFPLNKSKKKIEIYFPLRCSRVLVQQQFPKNIKTLDTAQTPILLSIFVGKSQLIAQELREYRRTQRVSAVVQYFVGQNTLTKDQNIYIVH